MANEESPREKAAERQEMALAALRYDLSTAKPLRELVRHAIETGARPEYIALRYGYLGATLERVLAFKARLDATTK